MKIKLFVEVDGVDGANAYRYATFGLPSGLALLDRVRENHPTAGLDSIVVNDWVMAHHGKVMFKDVREGSGYWSVELTEPMARESGRFETCTAVKAVLPLDEFKKSVSLLIAKSGSADGDKYIVTPCIERQAVYDAWAGSGFGVVE